MQKIGEMMNNAATAQPEAATGETDGPVRDADIKDDTK
jgi:hypothetical protein